MTISGNTPCYKCEERHFVCWSECKRYKAFRAAKDKILAKRLEDAKVSDFIITNVLASKAAAAKRKKWRTKETV